MKCHRTSTSIVGRLRDELLRVVLADRRRAPRPGRRARYRGGMSLRHRDETDGSRIAAGVRRCGCGSVRRCVRIAAPSITRGPSLEPGEGGEALAFAPGAPREEQVAARGARAGVVHGRAPRAPRGRLRSGRGPACPTSSSPGRGRRATVATSSRSLGPELVAAAADVRTDVRLDDRAHGPGRGLDHAAGQAPPTRMHDADGAVADQHDRHAVRRTHRQRATGAGRERGVGLGAGVLAGLGHLDDGRAVNLAEPCGAGREARAIDEVTLGPGRETESGDDAAT